MEWAKWMGERKHILKKTTVNGVLISTIFLGFDHNFFGDGPPVLFEAMVFDTKEGDEFHDYQERYTYEEAIKDHDRIVNKLK